MWRSSVLGSWFVLINNNFTGTEVLCSIFSFIFFNDVGQKLRNNYLKHTSDGVLYYSSNIFFTLIPYFPIIGVGNSQHEVYCGIGCFLLCFCSMFLIAYVEEFSFWKLVCFVKQQLYWY